MAALAAFPALASAANCDHDGSLGSSGDPSLVDGMGFSWDLTTYGEIDDGFNNAANRSDAFDTFADLYVSANGGASFSEYSNPDTAACTETLDGRQITFPDDPGTVTGVTLGRSEYVPASGLGFVRVIDTFTNTSGTEQTLIYRWGGNLGSDSSTTVAGTSNGDNAITEADSWSNTYEDPLSSSSDPLVTTVWDGTTEPIQRAAKAGRFSIGSAGYTESPTSDDITAEYNVVLAPGETKRFMHVVAMRLSADDQAAASAAIAAEPIELGAGLSSAEKTSIQNWKFDKDADGVMNDADNCPVNANPGQENLDGDAQGDVCDDDIDGDGLSNGLEGTLRTDPRKADTDGDGKGDSGDSCPTIAAATANGCPAPVVVPPVDKTAPAVTVAGTSKVSLKTLLGKGLKITVTSNEPTSFSFQLVGAAKSAKLAKAGDLVIATKSLKAGNGKRTVTLTIAKKWRKAISKKSKLTLQTVGTDANGNRTTKSSKLKLTK